MVTEAEWDLVWPCIALAEHDRLLRLHGYAKDNAIPPDLQVRLRDPMFRADVWAATGDLDVDESIRRQIAGVFQKLLDAARTRGGPSGSDMDD